MNTNEKSFVHLSANAKEQRINQNIKTANCNHMLVAIASRFLSYLKTMKHMNVKMFRKILVNEKSALPDVEETMLFNAVQTASRPHKLN